jgi:hypothetical protein
MGRAWRMTAGPRGQKTVTPLRQSLEPRALPYGPRLIPPQPRHGYVRGLPSRRDAVCGASTSR